MNRVLFTSSRLSNFPGLMMHVRICGKITFHPTQNLTLMIIEPRIRHKKL